MTGAARDSVTLSGLYGLPEGRSLETLLIDFHTHTDASDGALPPAELLAAAQAQGCDAMAITDHDTLDGYLSVKDQVPVGMTLVTGVELSCVWGGVTIHVVGLNFDIDAAPIRQIVEQLNSARLERAEIIDRRLGKLNMPGAMAGALAIAGRSQLGRPHFAQWMVEQGYVGDASEAFDRYLGQGKVGDVKTFWPTLADATGAIVAAGGSAVLAHPLKYKLTRTKLHALCRDFVAAGGTGLEILNGRQADDETARLKQLARAFAFKVSVGSDFHREWRYGPQLGVSRTIATGLPTIWDDFL